MVEQLDYTKYLKSRSKSLNVVDPVFIEACDVYAESTDIKEEIGKEDPLANTTENDQAYNTVKMSEMEMKSEFETYDEILIKEDILDHDMNSTANLDSAIKDRLYDLPETSFYEI